MMIIELNSDLGQEPRVLSKVWIQLSLKDLQSGFQRVHHCCMEDNIQYLYPFLIFVLFKDRQEWATEMWHRKMICDLNYLGDRSRQLER